MSILNFKSVPNNQQKYQGINFQDDIKYNQVDETKFYACARKLESSATLKEDIISKNILRLVR